ncbi:MAG: HEAT repeat domain-containing protein [Potamolinea sp.]
MVDFSAYLNFVSTDRRETRLLYTVTDVLLSREAQTVERQKPGNGKLEESHQPEVERFPVLTGIRKYAFGEKREHVLLAGRPGSGKSTTLKQILLEMTEAALTDDTQPIPVLVQLKGDRSIFDLISAEFRRAKLKVTAEQIDDWLLEDKLVLLLDGINEIPSEDLRTKLHEFRDNNRTTAMIFTTRDLALGGDFGIEKRLEMCPLSEPQMREFVQKYLPEHGEMLLGQISDRLREVAETPLLLKMLCDVYSDPRLFQKVGDLKSKGELFRLFDQKYNNWKVREGVKTSETFWQWNTDLLQHLAFVMLQGDGLTKPRFTIDKNEAERLIEKYLTGRVENPGDKAKDWLEDLVEHHLLQVAADVRQIEFHHQLFQEYYAAEGWLVMLRDKHSDVMDDQRLKHFYLNCLKWTEAIAMMLALLEDETQALRVVRLALEVDLYMGSRLAGEVKLRFQEQTVGMVSALDVPEWLKVELWGRTGSKRALPTLLKFLRSHDLRIAQKAAAWIGFIGDAVVVPELIQILESLEKWVVEKNLHTSLLHLGKEEFSGKVLSHEAAALEAEIIKVVANLSPQDGQTKLCEYIKEPSSFIDLFMQADIIYTLAASCDPIFAEEQALNVLEDCNTINSINKIHQLVELLSKLKSVKAPSVLIKKLSLDESTQFSDTVINYLGLFDSEDAVEALVELIGSPISSIREKAANALIKNRQTKAGDYLTRHLHKPDWDIRWCASVVLGEFGNDASLAMLSEGLVDENYRIRVTAAKLLGNLDPKLTSSLLISALDDSTYSVRRNAAISLAGFHRCEAIPELLKALRHYYPTDVLSSGKEVIFHVTDNYPVKITGFTQEALSLLGSHDAINDWLLERNFYSKSREHIIYALGKFDTREVQDTLIESLRQGNKIAAIPLAKFGKKEVIKDLIELLKNSHLVSSTSKVTDPLVALIEAGNCEMVPEIISLLKDVERHVDDRGHEDYYFRNRLAIVLMKIRHAKMPQYIPDLLKLLSTEVGQQASWVIAAIQANCQFYNYEIAQWKPKPLPPSPTDILVKIDKTTQDTNRRTKQMADQPKNDFSGAIFQAPVNFGDKNQGNFIGTQNNYAAPQATAAAQQLKTLLGKLRQKDPNATDEQLFDMLLNGFETMPQQNPQNWQRWQNIFSILFAGGVEATKILVPVAGIPIEVFKRLYEISQRHPKQLPGN